MLRAALVTGTAVTAAYFVYRRSKKNDHPGVELPALSATVEKPEPVVPPPPPVAAAPAPESRRGLHILHSGDFAAETADMICQKLTAANVGPRPVRIRTMDDFKKWSTEVMLTTSSALISCVHPYHRAPDPAPSGASFEEKEGFFFSERCRTGRDPRATPAKH